MRRRAFVLGLPLVGCGGLWRRAAPVTVRRPEVASPAIVQEAAVGGAAVVRAAMVSSVVHVGVSLASGAGEDGARPGLTLLALAAIEDRGLRDELAKFAARPVTSWAGDGGTISCACEARDVEAVVTVLARRLRAPVLDEVGFSVVLARVQAAAAIAAEDPRKLATRALDTLIFGPAGHPYAHRGVMTRSGSSGLTAAELSVHVRRTVIPARMMWISTGDVVMRPAIAAAWDGWTAMSTTRQVVMPAVAERAAIVLVERPGAEHVVIAAGRLGLAVGDDDAVYAARAMRVLRSAVHERLRGERGLVYFTEAEHDEGALGGRLRLITQVAAAAVGEALGVVLGALGHVRTLAVAQAWMDDQDTYDELEWVYAQDSGDGRIAALARRHRLGLPLVPRKSAGRPVAQLSKVMGELLRAEQWQIVCVGDRRALAQLEKFGPVVVRTGE